MREKFNKFIRHTSVKSLAIYLIIATVLSICVTFSKYIVGSTGADGARMIKMGELILKEDDGSINHNYPVMPGCDIKKIPTVTFTGSEADCYVFVEMTLGSAWEQKVTGSGTDPYTYCVYRKSPSDATKIDSNIRMSFSINKDSTTTGYGSNGWKYVQERSNPNQKKFLFATHIEANNAMTERHFFNTLSEATNNQTIDVSSNLTLEDINKLSTNDLDIKFLSVVMQDPGNSSASDCWNRLNSAALTP